MSFDSLKALTPTLREEGSEIWFSANPRSSADPFSQRFIKPFEKDILRKGYYEDDLHLIIMINYNDNPYFPKVLEQERAHDEKTLSRALYDHIWLGKFYDQVENTIIPVEWFDAAIDAHSKLGFKAYGAVIVAHDPSDTGGDSKGLVVRHGSVVLEVSEMLTGDVNEGCDWAIQKSLDANVDYFVWDCDGMGISLRRQVDKAFVGKKVDFELFKGSETPSDPSAVYLAPGAEADVKRRKTNKDTFLNKRAQRYWQLRDRFYNTFRAVTRGEYVDPDEMISLSPNIDCLDALRSEVCRIPLKRNNNGKIQIMTKLEMSKKPYQLPSPNLADSLMMAMYAPKTHSRAPDIEFEGW